MAEKERHIRPLSAQSQGMAAGNNRLAGRKILIVGGGQRIHDAAIDPVGNGRAMALLCAREGARVAVADRVLDSARETTAQIEAQGGDAFAIKADVAKPDDVANMVEQATKRLGSLDGMVLNVGIANPPLGLANMDIDKWERTLAVNLSGPMLCCKEGLRYLDDDASIIFISSIAALKAGSRLPAYDASKAGLGGLMRHVALEGSVRGIRANIICPGLVDTPIGRAASAGRKSRSKTPIPFGRMATAWEIAYAALFFLSDDSVYITAQTLAVDAGLSGL